MKTNFVIMMGFALLTGCMKSNDATEQRGKDVTASIVPSKGAKTLIGRWSWNPRYGIVVQVSPDKIQNVKIIEYSENGKTIDVPQTANATDGDISIVFDEHNAGMIGIGNYKISTSPILRDKTIYVLVSGYEVKINEMPNKKNSRD
jgi:hypothetical protein